MMKNLLQAAFLFLSITVLAQNGRMYIPSELTNENASEMRDLGMKMTIDDVYSKADGSIKDAIVHFNGGCTAEVISKQGLLLTNHHCGYSAIQSHSTVANDYLKDGFWAKSKAEELENPDMTVTFIVRIDNVTNQVLAGIDDTMDEKTKQKLIQKNLDKTTKNASKEAWQDVFIKSFFDGNEYHLFVTEIFKDIRLVGAPPSSIGKFGADTDNWMFPRHSGDFSLFRIYADKNNKPAAYAKDNVPYKPKHALPISLDGVAEDDFTLVYGFPGRTQEYLPAVAVDQIVHKVNPAGIAVRDSALQIMDKFMRKDKKIKIQYASKFAGIANYWKKWIGENQGIEASNAIAKKKVFEADFMNRVKQQGLTAKYGSLLSDFDKLYAEKEELAVTRNYIIEVMYRNTELLNFAFRLYQLEMTYDKKGEAAFNKAKTRLLKSLKGKYGNYNATVDKAIFAKLTTLYAQKVKAEYTPTSIQTDCNKLAKKVYKKSALTSYNSLAKILNIKDPKTLFKKLNKDKGYKVGKEFAAMFYTKINPKHSEIAQKIAAVQRNYMKAIMTVFSDKKFGPDANSTLRITYGQVKGYEPKDAVYYKPVSHLGGVMQKYIPGDYEFDVSPKLQALYKQKDFGNYADKDGKLAVNFLGTNHTTGGNSGSPVLDAHGNLIGLNFDRVWEGTMSDMNYDPTICRNIMVDVRYILFIIDKYAGAQNIIDELDFVHPKQSKQ